MSQHPTDETPVTGAHLRSLLAFVAAIVPVVILIFLLASRFFVAWEGRVTGVSPIGTEAEPKSYRVVVAAADHTYQVQTWPGSVVRQMEVPIDPLLVPPSPVDDRYPYTQKHRFQLHFLVEDKAGANVLVPTTSPQALGVAVLVGLVLVAIRNGYVSGSPIDIRPRPTRLPGALSPSGQVAKPPEGAKGRITAPPPKSKGGRHRKR